VYLGGVTVPTFPQSTLGDYSRHTLNAVMSALPSPELGSLFEAALNEFEERTGTELAQHQIFNELVACESIEAVVTVLQEQIKALPTSPRDYSKLMNRIKRTVQIIHPLSTDNVVMSGANLVCSYLVPLAFYAATTTLFSRPLASHPQ